MQISWFIYIMTKAEIRIALLQNWVGIVERIQKFKLLMTIDFEEQRRLEKAGFPKEAIDKSLEGSLCNH